MDPLNLNKAVAGAANIATGAEQALSADLQQIQTFIAGEFASFKALILEVIGEALADLTTERKETIDQLALEVHAVVDRFHLQILPRKTE